MVTYRPIVDVLVELTLKLKKARHFLAWSKELDHVRRALSLKLDLHREIHDALGCSYL
jgi:hypothetical protein